MKRCLLLGLTLVCTVGAEEMTAGQILAQMDAKMVPHTTHLLADLKTETPAGRRRMELEVFAEGTDKAFVCVTSPPRDSGTRFLRLGRDLWLYLPAVRKPVKLSGQMLGQSAFGSDFSYEDMTGSRRFAELYEADTVLSDTVRGKPCHVLELHARSLTTTYQRIRLWVDRARLIPLCQELLTKSGRVLKSVEELDYQSIGTYYVPTRVVFEDHLRRATKTTLVIRQVEFDTELPPRIFSLHNLNRP